MDPAAVAVSVGVPVLDAEAVVAEYPMLLPFKPGWRAIRFTTKRLPDNDVGARDDVRIRLV